MFVVIVELMAIDDFDVVVVDFVGEKLLLLMIMRFFSCRKKKRRSQL